MVKTSRDWLEKLPFTLWAYHSFHTSTRATPYSWVYSIKVIMSFETNIGSLRVVLEQQISKIEWAQA